MIRARSGPPVRWRKSSFSSESYNCVEVATSPCEVFVRHSKNPEALVLSFEVESWRHFIADTRAGLFDRPTFKA